MDESSKDPEQHELEKLRMKKMKALMEAQKGSKQAKKELYLLMIKLSTC